MTRPEILDNAKKCVCGQREQDYGSPENNFARIAALWNAYMGTDEIDPVDVAMMLALLKVARIKTGTGTDDSFVDLAGYAACAGEIATQRRIPAKTDPDSNSKDLNADRCLVCGNIIPEGRNICPLCAANMNSKIEVMK